MNFERFNTILNGEMPTANDFESFVKIIEQLNYEELWIMSIKYPKLNWMFRSQLANELKKKITRQNLDNAINSIVENFRKKIGTSG